MAFSNLFIACLKYSPKISIDGIYDLESQKPQVAIRENFFRITSPAFDNGSYIPDKYACRGSNISPPLNIENVPINTQSLALIMDDPDALDVPWVHRIWVHWVVWNIPPSTEVIKEGELPKNASQGLNDWERNDYGGPCPPSWRDHGYLFKLYSLDIELDLPMGSRKGDLQVAMERHIIDSVILIGRYAGDTVTITTSTPSIPTSTAVIDNSTSTRVTTTLLSITVSNTTIISNQSSGFAFLYVLSLITISSLLKVKHKKD